MAAFDLLFMFILLGGGGGDVDGGGVRIWCEALQMVPHNCRCDGNDEEPLKDNLSCLLDFTHHLTGIA